MRRYQVAAAILWNGSEVLIARRRAGDHQGGRWEFPGGKRHAGETVKGCLRRELREEIGIEADIGPLWRALTHIYPDRTVTLYFHFCTRRTGEPRPLDADELRWVTPRELLTFEFVEGDVPVLQDLARDLSSRVGRAVVDAP